jgi:hypothetical protein
MERKMDEELLPILKHLEFFRDNIRQGKLSINDIPDALVAKLVNVVIGEGEEYTDADFITSIEQLYVLARQCGDTTYQSACFEILHGILDMKLRAETKRKNCIGMAQTWMEGGLTDTYIAEHTWEEVTLLKAEGKVELFWNVCEEIRSKNIERIKKQDKIKVAFFIKDSAEWSTESLYRTLLQDDRYEVYVLVAPYIVGTKVTIADTYKRTVEYFENKGYQTYEMAEFAGLDIMRYKTWNELPVPDVVFMLNPYAESFRESCKVTNFPMKTLITYVPYGVGVFGNVDERYNQLTFALCWKIFWDNELNVEMCRKHADIGDRNALMCGYIKMDGFYEPEKPEEGPMWKNPLGKTNVKKIVYAPHWSIREAPTGFGNFDKIYDWIYEYAKNHADTTSWIFRPHPQLRSASVEYGLFATESDYDSYVKKWDELPNARVIEHGEYIDILKTSDAMIMDCISFQAEYQYTHKPLLFLTRETNTWDEFGEKLSKILYTAPGEDTDAIERFIEDVVINGNDTMKPERQAFFDKYLDYRARNGKLACEYVKDFLDETFTK